MGDCHVPVAADGRVPHRLAWGQGVVGAERAGTARACCARAVIEHGYDSATVAQIAQRAGLTSSTFFRHFTDKREVLHWGQQALLSSSPLQVLGDALDAVGTAAFGWERHEFALRRRAVIATSSELQERSCSSGPPWPPPWRLPSATAAWMSLPRPWSPTPGPGVRQRSRALGGPHQPTGVRSARPSGPSRTQRRRNHPRSKPATTSLVRHPTVVRQTPRLAIPCTDLHRHYLRIGASVTCSGSRRGFGSANAQVPGSCPDRDSWVLAVIATPD